jgi:hypothetical protein
LVGKKCLFHRSVISYVHLKTAWFSSCGRISAERLSGADELETGGEPPALPAVIPVRFKTVLF